MAGRGPGHRRDARAASGSPRRATGRGRSATGSSRRCSGSSSRTLEEAAVLDLFAGSGAGGDRGAVAGRRAAVLVEKDAGACRVIAENLRRARLEAAARVVRRDVIAWLADPPAPARRPVRPRPRRPAVRRHGAALVRALELRRAARRATDGVVVAQALLARRPAGAGRYAGVRARAPVRRDGAHVLPARRPADEEADEA